MKATISTVITAIVLSAFVMAPASAIVTKDKSDHGILAADSNNPWGGTTNKNDISQFDGYFADAGFLKNQPQAALSNEAVERVFEPKTQAY